MGKVQSKHGQCFVVNAHFNPACQLDEETHRQKTGLHLANHERSFTCSELSLSLCEETTVKHRVGFADDKYPLQEEGNGIKATREMEEERPEKAEEEKSEKEERGKLKMREVSCDVSVESLEKKEFFFTLYDFNGHGKITKDDVSGLVRSIYETLGKSIKLPPSGSRTIKVRLAVSPDSSPDGQSKDESENSRPGEPKEMAGKNLDSDHTTGTGRTVHTASTYLTPSTPEKPSPSHRVQICHHVTGHRLPSPDPHVSGNPPTQRPRKPHRSASLHRQEFLEWFRERAEKPPEEHQCSDNRHQHHESRERFLEEHHHRHKHRHQHATTSRDQVPECNARRSHYLDLAGVENYVSKFDMPNAAQVPPYIDPAYICPYRILDRDHVCPKSHCKDVPDYHCAKRAGHPGQQRSRSQEAESASNLFGYRLFAEPKDNLLNLNLDLCDLAPDEKFDWERHYYHRRSKSYDVHDAGGRPLGSPKPKPHAGRPSSVLAAGHLPPSPGHHRRHRHREKEKQRAMQQVASWIEREHLGTGSKEERNATNYASPSAVRRVPPTTIECHEHHHLHEHVHHHYHHYIDS